MTETEEQEWQERLAAMKDEAGRRKVAKAVERGEKAMRREYGTAARHAIKQARIDAAAVVDQSGTRCHYLISEEPPEPCPNERVPGGELCRPHLARAAELARRLGLIVEGELP